MELITSSHVHPDLEQLLVLQDRQQKIKQIQTEVGTLPLQRKNLEEQLAASVAGVERLKQKARQVEMDRKKLELDVGTRTETISRLKTQQYQTRKNDEFQAIGHEIERNSSFLRVWYCCVLSREIVSVRVPTSSSSFLRSISTCRAFCLSLSTPATLAANCSSRFFLCSGNVPTSVWICLIFCCRS